MAAEGERLAVGFFDGVHLGHRAVLADADGALTFANHPLSVLASARAPVLLMATEERLAAIRALVRGPVTALDFTPELAALPPEEFAARHFGDGCVVRCGPNWRFGRGGAGDAAWLRAHGYAVEVVPPTAADGEMVSSSRIRRALADGDLAAVERMAGRVWTLSGRIVRGKGLGTRLGLPTVNVDPGRPTCLRRGVYAASVGGMPAVANYGLAPTAGAAAWREPVLELHFIGAFDASAPALAGGSVTVELRRFLRDERAFGSFAELMVQIRRDIAAAGGEDA